MKPFFLWLLLLLLPLPVFGGVAINEVLFDPAGTDTGLEWIEIYNSGLTAENLSGWQLYPDGIGYFSFPDGFVLPPGSFVVVNLRTSGTNSASELYHSSASSNMGNTSGSAALFSGEPRGEDTIKSFVQWGRAEETWESDAEKAGLWTKGDFIDLSDFVEGGSITLAVDGVATGGVNSWKITPSPTTDSPSYASTSPPTISSAAPQVPIPQIKAYAGEDRTVTAGSLVEFQGNALGTKDEPLENARFWWNFGDGETKEGKAISHSFRIPGNYTVGLHVSSGLYAVSDYLLVKVVPNQLRIASVIPRKAGFIKIANPGKTEIDLGGWILESGGKQFVIPWKTKVAAEAEIAFANITTGLLSLASSPVSIRYPNGTVAIIWDSAIETKPAAVTTDKAASAQTLPGGESETKKNKAEEIVTEESRRVEVKNELAQVSDSASLPSWLFLAAATAFSLAAAAAYLALKRFGLWL